MKILILSPGNYSLRVSFYCTDKRRSLLESKIENYRGSLDSGRDLQDVLEDILLVCRDRNQGRNPDAIAFYGRYGGEEFEREELVNDFTAGRLRRLIPGSPLQIPAFMALLECCRVLLPRCPMTLHFGTSFFVDMPPREILYGLDQSMMKSMQIRRYGFHGLFHEAGCRQIARSRSRQNESRPARILSICLEPRPEVCAAMGRIPKMMTSGITPLEGLPGLSTCGEIDPSIALVLSKKQGWGPEQINHFLTRESGLHGLTGEHTDFDRIFLEEGEKFRLARDLVCYRILLACGAGLAAMGDLDAVIFSGRYLLASKEISRFLNRSALFERLEKSHGVKTEFLKECHDSIIADKTAALVQKGREARKLSA